MTATTSASPSAVQTSPPQSLTLQGSDDSGIVTNGERKGTVVAQVKTAAEPKLPAPAPLTQMDGKRSPRQTSPEAAGSSSSSPSRRSTNLAAEGDVTHASQVEQLRKSHAQRRPKMLRLTPAHSSAPPAVIKARDRAKVSFPGAGGEVGNTTLTIPLHPSSRKALALKSSAPSDAPPGLQLDLACLPVPTRDDKHNPASTSTIPELVRKKSGEPIKSSLKHYPTSAYPSRADSLESSLSSRAKSVPSTPTIPKAVHFGRDLEQVKVFKHKQRPSAVSRDGSPEQTETETEEEHDFPFFAGRKPADLSTGGARSPAPQEPQQQDLPSAGEEQLLLRLPNFPSSTKLSIDRDIFLERVFLADDLRSVRGTIQVRNIAFEKWVAVRFTLDNWATVNEVSADYQESIKDGAADRFTFSIKLNELLNWPRGAGQHETKSMFVCLRFRTAAHEIWDNNEGKNYQLDFRKRPVPVQVQAALKAPMDSSSSAAPRSARTKQFLELGRKGVSNMSRPGHQMMEDLKRELSKLKSDEEEVETAARPKSFAEEVSKRRSPPASPTNRSSSPSQWTARYDFGESLKNPTSGSRNPSASRTAGLDYFSHKFKSPSMSFDYEAARAESGQGWLAPEENSERGRTPPFSRVYAGREESIRHDGSQAGSRTPSPNLSPTSFTPTRFNTYPPRGNSPLSSLSPSYTPRTPSPVNTPSAHIESKSESFGARLDSALGSPTSPSGFSPSGSTASLDSATTIGFETSEDLFGRRPSSRSSTESMESTASFRPGSTTSLEDLVARFCWNSDTLSSAGLTPASATAFQQGSGPPTPRMPGP